MLLDFCASYILGNVLVLVNLAGFFFFLLKMRRLSCCLINFPPDRHSKN